MSRYLFMVSLVANSLFFSLGCSIKAADGAVVVADPEPAQGISESAVTEAGAQSTASEGASSPMIAAELSEDFQNMDYLDPQSAEIHPMAACSFASNRSTCTSNVSTIDWLGCTVGAATATGGWTETWSAGFCTNGASPAALTTGTSVNRRTVNGGEILTTSIGAVLTTTTTAHSAYDGTLINGNGITVANTSGTRTMLIDGLHKVLVGPRGRTWFDHSVVANPGLSVTGTRAAGTRTVTGSTTLYHNLALYKAVHTFNTVRWNSATCCYPTSGTVTSTLTGSKTNSLTLDFTAGATACGQATFTEGSGTPTAVTLTQCR